MLHLDHGRERVGVQPILEAHLIVERQYGLRGHSLKPRVRVRRDLGLRIEVVLVVALTAHLCLHGNFLLVVRGATERLHEVLVRQRERRGVVLVAVVAADGLGELPHRVVELLRIHAVTLAVHHSSELRGLACDTVGQLFLLRRARRFGHAFQRVHMARSLVVAERERVAFVHGVQRRIKLKVVVLARIGRVGLVLLVRSVLVRIDVLPCIRRDHTELVRVRSLHLHFVRLGLLIGLLLRSTGH